METLAKALGAGLLTVAALAAIPAAQAASDEEAIAVQRATPPDRSGKKRIGIASYYHKMFNGRKMADGKLFDPNGMEQQTVTGIAFSKDEAQISIRRVQDKPGVAAAIFGPLADNNINVDMCRNVSAPAGSKRPKPTHAC